MASYIDCVIDTEPMAREIDRVSNHVDGTTAAVVGMKAAVIKAESDAADHVCKNVNRGFYTLIHSQISQKIAKLSSDVNSHVMKLQQLQKRLLGLRERMQHDYAMTAQRYSKLFLTLNRDLHQRVVELDRPIIRFASDETVKLENRLRLLTAQVPIGQSETLTVSERILTGNLKYQAKQVLETSESFLTGYEKQENLMKHVLLPGEMKEAVQEIMVPVILMNYRQSADATNWNTYANSDFVSEGAAKNIASNVAQGNVQLQNTDQDKYSTELNALISNAPVSERVKQMMRNLHQTSFKSL